MPLYLPDTASLIEAQRRQAAGLAFIERAISNGQRLLTCDIVVAEFYAGANLGDHPLLDAILRTSVYVPVTFEVAYQAGRYRAEYRSRGFQLTTTDTLIAAAAKAAGATVVTPNIKDFPQTDIAVLALSSFLPISQAPDPSRG